MTETVPDAPPRRRRPLIWTVVVIVLIGGVLAGLWYVARANAGQNTPAADEGPPATTTVKRTDLAQVEQFDGTLGFGDVHEAAAVLGGMVTWLPAEGATVKRGAQEDVGLPETGAVEPGRVFVAAGEVRVTASQVTVGGRTTPGRTVLRYTGTSPVIDVPLGVADQAMARKGDAVTVILPHDERVKGTIRSVGTVARKPAQAAGAGATTDAVVDVLVTLSKPAAQTLDSAPVQVELVSERREKVLAVPVSALLALREGGYALELVEGGGTRLIGVKVGLFADGLVEVSGAGLAEGATVGTPKP